MRESSPISVLGYRLERWGKTLQPQVAKEAFLFADECVKIDRRQIEDSLDLRHAHSVEVRDAHDRGWRNGFATCLVTSAVLVALCCVGSLALEKLRETEWFWNALGGSM